MTVRLHGWSGPRNISTAMMRAWENRPDTLVVDEPFYASFLLRTGIDHPLREALIASQPTDPVQVVARLNGPVETPVLYVKQMAHHVADDADLSWLTADEDVRHLLLIREPAEVVSSYVRSREACEPADIGLLQQERLAALVPDAPVIDAGDFLRDPERHLRWICDWLGIDFTDQMLHWPAGPRDTDGVWAAHWYGAVQASTGFEPWRPREVHLSEHDAAVASACRPAYDALHARRLIL